MMKQIFTKQALLKALDQQRDRILAIAEAILRKIYNPQEKQESVTYRPGLVIRQSVRDLNEK